MLLGNCFLEAASKLSIGRMRHLKLADSFVRLVLKNKLAKSRKIPSEHNVADLLTKHVSSKVLDNLMPYTGWRAVVIPFVVVGLTKVNTIRDLINGKE